jgi:hypothetical protein
MSLTPERVADIMGSDYAREIPPVMVLCEDWLELSKWAAEAEEKYLRTERLRLSSELNLHQATQMLEDVEKRLNEAEAKLAGMRKEWRLGFRPEIYTDFKWTPATEESDRVWLEEVLRKDPFRRDFRWQSRYTLVTEWKDVEPV